MKDHIEHACHNEEFLDFLKKNSPHKFFDWKINVVFYCALHFVRAYSEMKGVTIGPTHYDLWIALHSQDDNPPVLELSSKALSAYKKISRFSKNARYDGFINRDNFERICEINFNSALSHLGVLKSYLKSQKMSLTPVG
jgi:hypothetical protein